MNDPYIFFRIPHCEVDEETSKMYREKLREAEEDPWPKEERETRLRTSYPPQLEGGGHNGLGEVQ